VIAWDGKTLAADKRMTTSWGAHDTVKKIGRARDGALYGITGEAAIGLRLLAWWQVGAAINDFPPEAAKENVATLVVVVATGDILQYTTGPHPSLLAQKHCAFGAGRDFAMAAMVCGKSAAEAVCVACELCVNCGNGIDTLTLEVPDGSN
jgi:hypothetical protein